MGARGQHGGDGGAILMRRLAIAICLLAAIPVLAGVGSYYQRIAAMQRPQPSGAVGPTLPAGTVRYYKFDVQTNSSGYWADYSESGTNYAYSGTGTAKPTWQTNGCSFDGGDWIVGTNLVPASASNMWFAVWHRSDVLNASVYVFSTMRATYNWALGRYNTGTFFIQNRGGLYTFGSQTTNWIHIVVQWSGPAGGCVTRAWTNGVLALTSTNALNYDAMSSRTYLGTWANSPGAYSFNGQIGQVAVGTNFLSDADVTSIYQVLQHQ